MTFYSNIASYYNRIFPFDEELVDFIRGLIPRESGKILDVGCATGALVNALGQSGHEVIGIDLDPEMIRFAKKYQNSRISFQMGDMLQLKNLFSPDEFLAVACFGNTLVHLPNASSIEEMFSQVFSILQPGGVFIGQIIHYDRIIGEHLQGLPTIEREGIRFERLYLYQKDDPRLVFKTTLTDLKSGQSRLNEVLLYPLTSPELSFALKKAGFDDFKFFEDTDRKALSEKSYALYFAAEKPTE